VWRLSLLQALAFVVTFVPVQWLFAEFLLSDASLGWFFGSGAVPYDVPRTSVLYRRVFVPDDPGSVSLAAGLASATGNAVLSTALGAGFASWLRRVRR
jgi:hypothetical protein